MMRHHLLAHLRNHEEVNEAVTTKTGYKYSDINHSVSIQYTVSIQQYRVYSIQYSTTRRWSMPPLDLKSFAEKTTLKNYVFITNEINGYQLSPISIIFISSLSY